MTRRGCRVCNGEGRVQGFPNAVLLHPEVRGHLGSYEAYVEMGLSILLCRGCKGSRYQVQEFPKGPWLPARRDYIRL